MRVVSGSASTGGSVAFTTAMASQAVAGTIANSTQSGTVAGTVGNTTLAESQIPSHTHVTNAYGQGSQNKADGAATNGWRNSASTAGGVITSAATGGGGSHNHSWSGTYSGSAHNHTFSGTAINMAVQYVDVIVATKD